MLIFDMMEEFRFMNRSVIDDIYGSTTEVWTEGARFDAAIIKNSTTEAQIAEKQGIDEMFTVVVKQGTSLVFNDVIKRVSDGQKFRITSNIVDSVAPGASSVKIGKVTAEKWVQTNA